MREYLTGHLYSNLLILSVAYLLPCFLLAQKAIKNVKRKSPEAQNLHFAYGWSRDAYWMHFGFSTLFFGFAILMYGFDLGWLVDIICVIAALIGLVLFLGFLQVEKVFITGTAIHFIPAFGKSEAMPFSQVRRVIVSKSQREYRDMVQYTYEVNLLTDQLQRSISEDTQDIKEMIVHLEEKIGKEKFEVVDKTPEEN
ncbi:hypothetical protein [Ekhidna sp.]|uniref:hypothetical protein n=1 Tax=Ekhidna sp. TaxID=2608089 RepID=UPI003B5C759B